VRRCACGCGRPVTGRNRKHPACLSRTNPFADDYAPYGHAATLGTKQEWRQAFRARFTEAELVVVLKDASPWEILGIAVGSSLDIIRKAYRAKARETHPDLHPGIDRALFQSVQAAYQRLAD
jgi:DnaJ-class molecular chaperone